ncbi:hypothetical protein [Alkalitalea saponilacus]|nr:hypothetical protein [Alkalitalea saponilacus]
MKNILQITSFAILGAFLVASLQSCSSDKKDSATIDIEGVWRITHQKVFINGNDLTAGLKDTNGEEDTNTEEEDSDLNWEPINYNENDPVQYYVSFENGTYKEITVSVQNGESNQLVTATGTYSLNKNELVISKNQITYLAEINYSSNTLYLYFDFHPEIMESQMVRASLSPDNGTDDNNGDDENGDKDDNGDNEGLPNCAARHQRDARVGSKLNPKLIESDVIVEGTLPDDTENGFLYRYYLQVKPYAKYNISISEISADYNEDIHESYHYMDVIIKEEFVTDYILKETRIHSGKTSELMSVTPATECLYIEFFSFQESIEFKLEITEQE